MLVRFSVRWLQQRRGKVGNARCWVGESQDLEAERVAETKGRCFSSFFFHKGLIEGELFSRIMMREEWYGMDVG